MYGNSMYGDFSRDSFDVTKRFTRLLLQQGRLIVDADWNEQTEILLHYLRTLASDVIGWHGGPNVSPGNKIAYPSGGGSGPTGPFQVAVDGNRVNVTGAGSYYVDGLLVEFDGVAQRDDPLNEMSANANRLVLLDVWEQCDVTDPVLLDPALGGLDTITRAELKLRFRSFFTNKPLAELPLGDQDDLRKLKVVGDQYLDWRPDLPTLKAWTNLDSAKEEDCAAEADDSYTGLENQLYRVEIHRGGKEFWNLGVDMDTGKPIVKKDGTNPVLPVTFKWSRDNGSVAFKVKDGSLSQNKVTLIGSWRDDAHGIRLGQWIEIRSEDDDLHGVPGVLVEVAAPPKKTTNGVEIVFQTVKDHGIYVDPPPPGGPTPSSTVETMPGGSLIVRRWDHAGRKDFPLIDGAVPLKLDATSKSVDILIEKGIHIRMSLTAEFRRGDHWLIPARAAIDDIVWPIADPRKTGEDRNKEVAARYVVHHYAPIAFLLNANTVPFDLRNRFVVPPARDSIGETKAAAGTNSGDATVLPAGTAETYPITGADDTKGVRLDHADRVTGRRIYIGNLVSNKILKVYGPAAIAATPVVGNTPATLGTPGATINGGAPDAAILSESGKGVIMMCLDAVANTWLAW